MGVKATRVVKYIRKGETGDKGEQGAVLRGPQAWSDCALGYAFQSGGPNEKWIDVVLYNNNYYVCKQSHTKTGSNYPGSFAGDSLWQLGDKIALVATNILLANYALIKNLGVEAVDMRDAGGNVLFQVKDGNVTCKTGTFQNCIIEGYFQTKFTEVGSGSFTINDVLNISTYGGSYSQVITLPSSPSFIGKRVCIVNNNYPPYTKTSLAYYTTIQVDATLQSNYIGIGGNIDVDASGHTEPQAIKSIAIRGGVVELLAVPANWADDRYSRWIVVSGKHSIMYYTTI